MDGFIGTVNLRLNLKGEETAADRSESETHGRQKQGDTYHPLHSHSQSATGGGMCVWGGDVGAVPADL